MLNALVLVHFKDGSLQIEFNEYFDAPNSDVSVCMGRCNGYRPTKANREEYEKLRAALHQLDSSQWVKASYIMREITALLGHAGGPMNGKIEPRACRYCGYFGHTRQFCKARLAHEEAKKERLLEEDRRHFEMVKARPLPPRHDPYTMGQAKTFNDLRIPFTVDPDLGAMVGVRGEAHDGLWTYDAEGRVTLR